VNKKAYNGIFGLLMVMCVVLVVLVKWYGITGLEIALSILYVGLGGFFAGISWNKVKVWSLR